MTIYYHISSDVAFKCGWADSLEAAIKKARMSAKHIDVTDENSLVFIDYLVENHIVILREYSYNSRSLSSWRTVLLDK